LRAAALLAAGAEVGVIYEAVGQVLVASQTAMLLEILHALLGLVPSPVATVTVQVLSRIFIVWGHLYWVPDCQRHWSLLLIVFSWGITEVVRYAFYFCSLLGSVPYPIFYLRYSMFVVLYPTGITGEILQALVGMGAHWSVAYPLWYRLSLLTLILYVPGSPGMIGNMLANRRRSFQKRNSASRDEPILAGVVWPRTQAGDRSSTSTSRGILAAAASAGPGGKEAGMKVLGEKKWRFGYKQHLLDHVAQSLESPEGCLAMARAGLAAAQTTFRFVRDGHPEMSLKEAMSTFGAETRFETAELSGEAAKPEKFELSLRYGGADALGKQPYYKFDDQRKKRISGDELGRQLDAWVQHGTMEADVATALKKLQEEQEEWLDLSDMYFVLLGAASAMGPLEFLLSLGANVIAVARPKALRGVMEKARTSPGRLLFPVRKGTDWKGLLGSGDLDTLSGASGCDLMTETPEIAAWLLSVAPGKGLTVGNYTYLDGALHMQIAVACDSIIEALCKARPETAVAFLGTPTDAHVVTREAATAAVELHERAPLWMRLLEVLGLLKQNQPIPAGDQHFMDCIVVDQGPNYILSKRLQHWRAMVARDAGHVVSSNVSPATATTSVTSNSLFAAAYGGMHIFRPMEVAYQELSLSLMGALLIHDLRNPSSAANPATELEHPLCLFQATAFHSGMWRCPYTIGSLSVPSAVRYYLANFWPHLVAAAALLVALLQYVAWGSLPWAVQAAAATVPEAVTGRVSAAVLACAEVLSVPLGRGPGGFVCSPAGSAE